MTRKTSCAAFAAGSRLDDLDTPAAQSPGERTFSVLRTKVVHPDFHEIHGVGEIEKRVEAAYRGLHQYDWVRSQRAWLDARSPVYLDFGEDHQLHLKSYEGIQAAVRPTGVEEVSP